MLKGFLITTQSGSKYTVAEDENNQFWISAFNVPNKHSKSIVDRDWPIIKPQPWPPVIGRAFYFWCIHWENPDHPERMPGGGKITSDITEIKEYNKEDAIHYILPEEDQDEKAEEIF